MQGAWHGREHHSARCASRAVGTEELQDLHKERLGLACALELSSLQPEPKDMRPLTPVPAAYKEQDIPAPLGLFSGARQSPEALAKGGSKSPSASTAHPSPQQLQLKAPVLGELLEITSHHLKANMTGL